MSKLKIRVETDYSTEFEVEIKDVDETVKDQIIKSVLEILHTAKATQNLPIYTMGCDTTEVNETPQA